jgi:hypothetical protein
MFRHDCSLAVEPASTPQRLLHKQTWTDSLPIRTFLSAVCVSVVAQPGLEVSKELKNYPVLTHPSVYADFDGGLLGQRQVNKSIKHSLTQERYFLLNRGNPLCR